MIIDMPTQADADLMNAAKLLKKTIGVYEKLFIGTKDEAHKRAATLNLLEYVELMKDDIHVK